MCVCVYTVITNGFSSFHCSCTILKSRGQRYPCHFLCQRSWVTCGKDIDQGRLIYVPAIVSTVDFLFLFMSCALFLRSGTCVRWNSTARQLRKSGEDYDILHTFDWPLPHSVSFSVPYAHEALISSHNCQPGKAHVDGKTKIPMFIRNKDECSLTSMVINYSSIIRSMSYQIS